MHSYNTKTATADNLYVIAFLTRNTKIAIDYLDSEKFLGISYKTFETTEAQVFLRIQLLNHDTPGVFMIHF